MLNISHNSINRDKVLKDQSSYQEVMKGSASRKLVYLLAGFFLVMFIVMFLPWTQNIRAKGKLTTLRPENREQEIHSVISGRIEKWYTREGQFVNKGDTIVFISEMKSDYLDPNLIEKAGNQTEAKKESISTYEEKAAALADQIVALQKNQRLKVEQANNYYEQSRLKVLSDSIDFQTAQINYEIAKKQFDRQQKLYDQGLKSLTELESRKQKLQESLYKQVSIENNWLSSKNKFINARLNLSIVQNEFSEKIAKAKSERMSALSNALQAEGDYNKLSIMQSNYFQRSGFYYIKAPQDGYVTKAIISGIGETVKEGASIFSFVPSKYDLAVEMYIRPIDLPLIEEGRKVQLQFDGWPALVFNGWPDMSFGTFSGRVVAFDKAASPNGKFRILVAPDPNTIPWPKLLRLGTGTYGIALLKNVPVWYELWRNLNGFPPDFYKQEEQTTTKWK